MTPDQLRELADALDKITPVMGLEELHHMETLDRAADYLRAQADAVPVGTLAISTFRGRSEKQNRDFDYTGGLPDGSYSLYTAPMPAAPQELAPQELAQLAPPKREPCIGNDPACPCQDGDACHYRDTATTKAWPIPQAEQKRPQTCLWSRADDDTDMWETTCGNAFTIIDGSPADNQMAFCCYCGRELESECADRC